MSKDKRKTNKDVVSSQMKSVDTGLKDGVFIYTEGTTINDFSTSTNILVSEIITYFFKQGHMFNINHILDENQIAELCIEYEFDFQKEEIVNAANFMDKVEVIDDEDELVTRPPIITVMGHVDHGKTTLIDKIRNSDITGGEAGGITQHTGAYQVEYKNFIVTFLDTPGHEAFTSMRARGAQITDIVVLVVAADDGVMPQTKEAIDHALAAEVSLIVFVNKMDKPGADPEKVKSELAQYDIVADDWGGDAQFVYGSALKGEGIDNLFNAINLQSELLELKANPNRMAIGTVVEAKVDKGQGTIATIIVENGSLHKRDFIVAGSHYGKIRTMLDSHKKSIEIASPGMPVIITGLNYTPSAGDKFFAFKDEKFAKNLAEEKKHSDKKMELRSKRAIQIKDGVKIVNIIIKADVQGTAEAVKHSLAKLGNEEATINVVRTSVGSITKSDVLLAQAASGSIYSFNLKPSSNIESFAKDQKIEIRNYSIIYKMIEDVQKMLSGLKAPVFETIQIGTAQIVKVIPASKIGNIAGCIMESGYIKAKAKVKLLRNGKEIHEGILDSLQRGADQAKKVESGKDFGCHIKGFNMIEEGDVIEIFDQVEILE